VSKKARLQREEEKMCEKKLIELEKMVGISDDQEVEREYEETKKSLKR
jgi:hypothetical protein